MTTAPLFISRINVANAQDTTLVILGAPSGPIENGQVGAVEVGRLVMSHKTFKEVAELFAAKVREIEAMAHPVEPIAEPEPRMEKRVFIVDEDEPAHHTAH